MYHWGAFMAVPCSDPSGSRHVLVLRRVLRVGNDGRRQGVVGMKEESDTSSAWPRYDVRPIRRTLEAEAPFGALEATETEKHCFILRPHWRWPLAARESPDARPRVRAPRRTTRWRMTRSRRMSTRRSPGPRGCAGIATARRARRGRARLPSVLNAGLVVGGEHGKGVLRVGGTTVERYSHTGGSIDCRRARRRGRKSSSS